jgi:hypothetical protein
MKNLLEEIREQPEYIRHIFMWACVTIVFSVVGFFWFKNTEKRFIALLNPSETQQEEKALAEKTKSQPASPFAAIFSAWENLKANISELILGKQVEFNVNNDKGGLEEEQLPPQKLPLSE